MDVIQHEVEFRKYLLKKIDRQEILLNQLSQKVEKIEIKFYFFTAIFSLIGGALMQAFFQKILT